MKWLLKIVGSAALVLAPAALCAQEAVAEQGEVMAEDVPTAVVVSAVEAVGALGDAVVQGRYSVALERMNPKWKERTAARIGGMEVLEKKLAQVATEMVRHGVTMTSCKPQGQPQAFGVLPKPRDVRDGGTTVKRLASSHWLVLVPTVTHFQVMQKNSPGEAPRWVKVESTGFQVAVSDRDRLDWTFIDGAGLTVNELRSLFPTLPHDLQLPAVGKRETR